MSAKVVAGFSVPVSIAFCVNYVVGAGSLSLPWAFNKSGSLLGICMMTLVGYFSLSAVLFLLETMARANAIYSANDRFRVLTENSFLLQKNAIESSETAGLIVEGIVTSVPTVQNRKFEISELCQIFLGKRYKLN